MMSPIRAKHWDGCIYMIYMVRTVNFWERCVIMEAMVGDMVVKRCSVIIQQYVLHC